MNQETIYSELNPSSDRQLLDAYSLTITDVVRKTAQAVVHIKVFKKIKDPKTINISNNPDQVRDLLFPAMDILLPIIM